MTIFDVCKSAAIRINGNAPTAFFNNTDRFAIELAELTNETVADIAKSHDWQALKILHTLTGDGVTTTFAPPSDFDRFVKDGEMRAVWLNRPLCAVKDDNEWFDDIQVSYKWGYIGGQIKFTTAIPLGSQVQFYYITTRRFMDSGGTAKGIATNDGDVPRIPERPVMLGVIWRWRQMKRLEYSEDMRTAEIALEQAVAHDKPRRPLMAGSKVRHDIPLAYDGVITP